MVTFLPLLLLLLTLPPFCSFSSALPNSHSLDEAHVGHAVNGYLTKTFTFDRHPPLAKLILAGISSLAGYQGDFAFEEIGE